ncbi:hypothetical protein B9G69_006095 [Bdellovibrio sp. SKB1291214]|uniref:CFI-box-CTERM domain-containing protein n=1 Tax=Bdellovibrio sp. SKB1291214 TaxID=1732569 RepID=UPI001C3CD51A|nr:CFI-box-CTERM domain-containing protein [Bdellovibrio sp. SKB1291214]UYL10149.1 hypothetical protein B9G69_006095 [Bdellovibrio sp. SKB1291214]
MATLTYNSVGGVSNIDTTTTPTKPVIYGGFAGTCPSGTDSNSTCDTCQGGTGMAVCNKNAVYPSLYLTIVLNTSSTIANTSDVTAKLDSNNIYPTITLGSGTVTLKFLWSDICAKSSNGSTACDQNVTADLVITAAGSSSGSAAGTFTFHIVTSVADSADLTYIDCPTENETPAAGSGFCHFTAFPGDSKVYADNLGISDSYPTSSAGVDYKSLMFFYEPQIPADANDAATVARITNKSPSFEMNINNTVSPPTVDERITGLSNGTTYCFIMGNRDLTGNIYFFTPTGAASGAVDPATQCTTPEKVVGLLDDKHCFIATAAFGSDMAPEVQSFREFRNEYLLPYSWGKTFVKTYYKYSPKYAALISQSETAKVLVRGALWPLLFFARMSVAIGFWYALAIVAFGALTLWGLYRRLILGQNVRGEL